MTDAVIYTRVSSAAQAEEGLSLAAQEKKLREWAGANGHVVLAVHTDAGISGKRADNRAGLQAALSQVCEKRAALLVYSLSRLARSTTDAITIAQRLDKAGADLVSLSESLDTTTAAGRMLFTMMAMLGQFERELIGERTKLALQFKKSRHEKLGGSRPYGFMVKGGKLEADPHEQAGIRLAVGLRRQGLSLRAIARRMHQEGYTARPLSGKSVSAILRRQGPEAVPLRPKGNRVN